MKAALKTLFSIAKSQNTIAKTIMRAHRDKNEQCLLSSRSALTTSSAYYIHRYCNDRVRSDPIASLVLIMLYSGRNCHDVINNLEQAVNCEGQQELRLYTPWSMPKNENDSNAYRGTCLSDNMYLVIPARFKPAEKLKGYPNYNEKLESWVQDFIPMNKSLPSERITLSRIKLLLSHYGAFTDISDYENAFISGKKLENESHQSYGIIDRNLIQCKFDSFRQALETSNLKPQSVTYESLDFQAVGSNFTSDTAVVSTYFERITRNAIKVPLTLEQHCLNYNTLTEFTVAYLSLCTLHRPKFSPFGKIQNFDLHAGVISILDKGTDSYREVPLSDIPLKLVNDYISFLTFFARKYRYVFPCLSADVKSILNGETPLFQRLNYRVKRLAKLKPNFMKKYTENLGLKNNYERHYVTSFLVKRGYSRNKLKLLLGHASPSTRSARFNSCDYNLLHSLVNEIECHMNLPTKESGLGIKIPNYLYE